MLLSCVGPALSRLQEYNAYMLFSVAGDVEIMQIVDPMYTIVAKIKRSLLSELK